MRFSNLTSRTHYVAVATALCFLCFSQPSLADPTKTITDAEAQCGAAVKAEAWPDAADHCSGLVRHLSDVLAASHDLSKVDRLALEEAIVTFAAVTAHAYAESGDLKEAKFYIFVATNELEIAASDGLGVNSNRYQELKRAIDTANADLPTN